MIQTDKCTICNGGIYRDISATWETDAYSRWWHMDPDTITTPHIAHPAHRSNDDDDTANDRATGC